MRIVILGPQGCGKGTQGRDLAEVLDVGYFGTGDIFRLVAEEESELGREVEAAMRAGRMVEEKYVFESLVLALTSEEAASGFVLDGYPRRLQQVDELDAVIHPHGLDRAVFLDLPLDVAMTRVLARLVCSNARCGTIYGPELPPALAGKCDKCGAAVGPRLDDTVEALEERHAHYRSETLPAVEAYEGRGLLLKVDASLAPAIVRRQLIDGLGLQVS